MQGGGLGQTVAPRTADPPSFQSFHLPGPPLIRGAPEQSPAPVGRFDGRPGPTSPEARLPRPPGPAMSREGQSGPGGPPGDRRSLSPLALPSPGPPLVRRDPEPAPAPAGRSDGREGSTLPKRLFQSRTRSLSHTGPSLVWGGQPRKHGLSPPLTAHARPLPLGPAEPLRLFLDDPLLCRATFSPRSAEERMQPPGRRLRIRSLSGGPKVGGTP
ncbi:hypothetical protein NDU88_000534 [Pleurodeles waltl]|uniref:Basic proline-rich protein-like n=1 Tax=Pleurodeles waltl TaxID=8319 RepID=A0AAV7N864_PLEWA|nr:hypothetical protein NDU88_000534 [Pleurodeles waltl]